MKLDKNGLFLLIVGICIGVVVGVVGTTISGRAEPAPIVITLPDPTPLPTPEPPPAPVQVFVSGEVANPDVYELPAGTIVADAINLAGGFTANANPEGVNLAQPLLDGMQIRVPAIGEEVSVPALVEPESSTSNSGGTAGSSGEKININTATAEELDSLPGIGPSTAAAIIAYREENGLFTSIEGLLEVTGIGPAKFDEIKDLVTVE